MCGRDTLTIDNASIPRLGGGWVAASVLPLSEPRPPCVGRAVCGADSNHNQVGEKLQPSEYHINAELQSLGPFRLG